MAESDFQKETIDVSYKGGVYVFRIPNVKDEMTLPHIERKLRREYELAAMSEVEKMTRVAEGSPAGLDYQTLTRIQAIACFQHLLQSADTPDNWCFSKDSIGRPVINYENWDAARLDDVSAIWMTFITDLNRFRSNRDSARQAQQEAMAGQPNP